MARGSHNYARNAAVLHTLTCIFYILNRIFGIISGASVFSTVTNILFAAAMGFALVCSFLAHVSGLARAGYILFHVLLFIAPVSEIVSLLILLSEGIMSTELIVTSIVSFVCGILLIVAFAMALRRAGRKAVQLRFVALIILCIAYTVEIIIVVVQLARDPSLAKMATWSLLTYFSYVLAYFCYGAFTDQQRHIGQ